jgi:hypothetical protein
MNITNKQIITNQLNRINEKAQANFKLVNVGGALYLTEDKTFGKISSNFIRRTSSQMIEYLAGLEDAIDAMPKRNY